jgi:hypothetical protein
MSSPRNSIWRRDAVGQKMRCGGWTKAELFTLKLNLRAAEEQVVATRQIIRDDSSFQVPPLMIFGYFGRKASSGS